MVTVSQLHLKMSIRDLGVHLWYVVEHTMTFPMAYTPYLTSIHIFTIAFIGYQR